MGEKREVTRELTESIIGACMEVSNELGSGFLENVYENALLIALHDRGLSAEQQVPMSVIFRGKQVGNYFADITVEGSVILELKTVSKLIPEHESQLLNYLNASNIKIGLLVNFGKPRIEWKRLIV